MCVKDPDIVTMFKLIGTMKDLGLRKKKSGSTTMNSATAFGKKEKPYDIEFPTRNHLKVFLARVIVKRRKQLEKGLCDLH